MYTVFGLISFLSYRKLQKSQVNLLTKHRWPVQNLSQRLRWVFSSSSVFTLTKCCVNIICLFFTGASVTWEYEKGLFRDVFFLKIKWWSFCNLTTQKPAPSPVKPKASSSRIGKLQVIFFLTKSQFFFLFHISLWILLKKDFFSPNSPFLWNFYSLYTKIIENLFSKAVNINIILFLLALWLFS